MATFHRKSVLETKTTDILLHDSWDFSVGASGSTATATDDDAGSLSIQTAPSLEDKTDCKGKGCKNVHVSVSGVVFSIESSIFKKLEPLPWKLISGTDLLPTPTASVQSSSPVHGKGYESSRIGNHSSLYFHLDTSPVLFEMLLNFLIFGTLPVFKELSISDIEELEPLAMLLELHEIQDHLEKKLTRNGGSFRCLRPRRCSSQEQQPQPQTKNNSIRTINQPKTIDDASTTNGINSNETSLSGKSKKSTKATSHTTAFRMMQVALKKRCMPTSSSSSSSKVLQVPKRIGHKSTTHAHACATSNHLN